jgi:hypothetical protein
MPKYRLLALASSGYTSTTGFYEPAPPSGWFVVSLTISITVPEKRQNLSILFDSADKLAP